MTTWCLYFFRFFTRWYVPKIEICLKYNLDTKFPKAAIVETTYYSWSFILIVHRLHGRLVVLSLGRSCSLWPLKVLVAVEIQARLPSWHLNWQHSIIWTAIMLLHTFEKKRELWFFWFLSQQFLSLHVSFPVKKLTLKGFTLNYPRHALW